MNLKKQSGIGTYTGMQSVLLPHEVFHTTWTHAREIFHYLFVGDDTNLANFWENTARTDPEFVADHPVCASNEPCHIVPLGMHGDDAGLFEHEKALVLSWNSVAVQRTTIDNRILFGTMACSKIITGLTLHQFYLVFVWSMNCLAEGKFPARDHRNRKFGPDYYPERAAKAGNPLAGNYVGAWSEFRGDLIVSCKPFVSTTPPICSAIRPWGFRI